MLVLVAGVLFAVVAVLVETCLPVLMALDWSVMSGMYSFGVAHPEVTAFTQVWTDVFGPWPWRLAVGAVAAYLAWRGAVRQAAWALTAITAGGVLGWLVKIVTARPRPELPDPLSSALPDAAFPSGHAVAATIGAGIFVLVLRSRLSPHARALAWGIAALLAVSVAYTRVALTVHWLSDAVGGVLLGLLVLSVTTAAFAAGRAPAPVR
ncbi:phosphatase PAP2 family protein [Nonomuraea typhae]|uniref:phosphatase PAP2 family protein n=1 Tax=Nonomuraea typhae TaxID=2603600 RepID=UPI0012FBE788|nr:phosphatase PAP2 family protein [Nonomuraea typhae]